MASRRVEQNSTSRVICFGGRGTDGDNSEASLDESELRPPGRAVGFCSAPALRFIQFELFGGTMSISHAVAPHIPFLRRFARALTGTQASGDAYVMATLEAILAEPECLDAGLD